MEDSIKLFAEAHPELNPAGLQEKPGLPARECMGNIGKQEQVQNSPNDLVRARAEGIMRDVPLPQHHAQEYHNMPAAE